MIRLRHSRLRSPTWRRATRIPRSSGVRIGKEQLDEALADVASGRVTRFESEEEFLAALEELDSSSADVRLTGLIDSHGTISRSHRRNR
jgi:hypothetical protein